jgi:AAA family ATP:ADP antiporter
VTEPRRGTGGSTEANAPEHRGLGAKILRPFAEVKPEELGGAVLMALTVFLLLTSYYLLKTAREPLILLQKDGGAAVKAYAGAGQSALLMFVVPAYAYLAQKVGRAKLLTSIYLSFAANLVIFAFLTKAGDAVGIVFFLWVGVFNVTAVSQFWSFANDIYTPEQGKRLFPILGAGSSLGAIAGSGVAHFLARLGPATMMASAAGILVVCVVLMRIIDARQNMAEGDKSVHDVKEKEKPPVDAAGIKGLVKDKYLFLIALLVLLLNWVNSAGEYMIDRSLLKSAAQLAHDAGLTEKVFVTEWKADYLLYANILGAVVQLFFVSRIFKYLGVGGALMVMPIISLLGYSSILVLPMLTVVRVAKIAENGIDYSLETTTSQALYLVGSRSEKYVGKTTIDTFIQRVGDMSSAGIVWIGTKLAFEIRTFAAVNVGLIGLWLTVAWFIRKENTRRSENIDHGGKPGPVGADPTAASVGETAGATA